MSPEGGSAGRPRPSAVFFTQSFPPETHAGANRAVSLAEALSFRFDLTVITPLPSHPKPERFSNAETASADSGHQFEIIRSSAFTPHSEGYLRRGVREAGMAARLTLRKLPSADVIIASSPSFFLGPMGRIMAKLKRSRFVWDIRDLTWAYTQEGLAAGGERRRLRLAAADAMTRVATYTLRSADLVVASNPGIEQAAREQGRTRDIHLAQNGVDRSIYRALAECASSLPENDRPVITYAGALGYFQDLESFLEAAKMLPEYTFRLVGDGSDRRRLEQIKLDHQITNVEFIGYVNRATLFDIYRSSDVLFAQLKDLDVMSQATFPSKIFEYMATGRPTLYAGRGITADFIRDHRAGVIADPGNAESIRQGIEKLAGDRVLREEIGQQARRASAEHIRQELAEIAADRVLQVVTTPDSTPAKASS